MPKAKLRAFGGYVVGSRADHRAKRGWVRVRSVEILSTIMASSTVVALLNVTWSIASSISAVATSAAGRLSGTVNVNAAIQTVSTTVGDMSFRIWASITNTINTWNKKDTTVAVWESKDDIAGTWNRR